MKTARTVALALLVISMLGCGEDPIPALLKPIDGLDTGTLTFTYDAGTTLKFKRSVRLRVSSIKKDEKNIKISFMLNHTHSAQSGMLVSMYAHNYVCVIQESSYMLGSHRLHNDFLTPVGLSESEQKGYKMNGIGTGEEIPAEMSIPSDLIKKIQSGKYEFRAKDETLYFIIYHRSPYRTKKLYSVGLAVISDLLTKK